MEAVFSGGGNTLTFNVDVITTTSLIINDGMTVIVNGDLIVYGAFSLGNSTGATLTVYGDMIVDGLAADRSLAILYGGTLNVYGTCNIRQCSGNNNGQRGVTISAAINADVVIFELNQGNLDTVNTAILSGVSLIGAAITAR